MAGQTELDTRSEDHWLAPGGPGGRKPTPERIKQPVLDAAAVLQVRRGEAIAALSRDPADAVVLAVGEDVVPYLREASASWRDLLSIRTSSTSEQMRMSLPYNRTLIDGRNRLQMISVFDHDAMDPDARLLLANEPVGDYRIGFATIQMKIIDRRYVILEGPFVDGERSIIRVTSGPCLDAAWRYWDAVLATAIPARHLRHRNTRLTPRQQQVVALLADELGDDAIAAVLGVSVRTVRSDIAAVLDSLGVKSRFAAGLRLRLESSTLR